MFTSSSEEKLVSFKDDKRVTGMVQVITGATCKQHKACDWKSEISIVEAVTKHKSLGSLFEPKV